MAENDEANDNNCNCEDEEAEGSRAIFTLAERQFLRERSAKDSNDWWHKKHDIKTKTAKAFKEDIPLIVKNADWIFEDKPLESLEGIEQLLYQDIKTLYFIHYQAILKEREEAKLKPTVAQRVIWKRVTHTISEVKREVRQHFEQIINNQHNKQEKS